MKTNKLLLLIAVTAVPALCLTLVGKSLAEGHDTKVARGKYLVNFGGCNDCHTPHKLGPAGPQPDLARLLSGHPDNVRLPSPPTLPSGPWMAVTTGDTAWSGPWGISYSANLTPDPVTGLGIWTEDMFIKAMRAGKHMSAGRNILPPMPWQSLARLSDDDLKAVFAYLRSIPAVRNHVPAAVPPGGAAGLE